MLRTSVLGLVVTSGFAVYASSLFPVPRPLGHDHAIDPRLQVLAMGSVFGRAEVNATTVYQSSYAMPTTAPQTSPAAQRRTYRAREQPGGCPAGVEFGLLCSECGGFQIMYHEDVPRFSTHRCLGVSLDFAKGLKTGPPCWPLCRLETICSGKTVCVLKTLKRNTGIKGIP
jgi:hypothetical protein